MARKWWISPWLIVHNDEIIEALNQDHDRDDHDLPENCINNDALMGNHVNGLQWPLVNNESFDGYTCTQTSAYSCICKYVVLSYSIIILL